jgi:hypothetical protein
MRGAKMSEQPSTESVREGVEELHEEANLGSGDQEPDPATGESPPEELEAGDEKREKGPSSGTGAS